LPQHLLTEDNCTVFEETSKAFSGIFKMRDEIEAINQELTVRTDYESDEYYKLIERVSEISEKFYSIEEINYDGEVEKVLKGMGFEREDFTRPTAEFSGAKAVVVISHDRAFIDAITTRTIEVTMGRIYDYKAKYSHYLELRKDRRAQQQKQFEEQQKFIAETTEFIERFKGTYSKTLQVQSRVKMLEKLEIIEVDEIDNSALRLRFPPAPRSGKYPVIINELSKKYDEHVVFKNASFSLERGEKVAFVGKNGEGKSTMVKALMGEIDFEGSLELGHNTQIGYFAQNQASLLDESLTVYETIDRIAEGDARLKIRDILGAFMFGGDNSTKKVKVLSGGEKTRLAMIKLLLEPVNLLILDEPTNHLDMKTKDIIKEALKNFDGTLILVSHDRDFLDGLVTKVFEFGNKKVTTHFDDINGFLQTKKMENMIEIERKN
jgi:ATP-binding cassette subfamily F protein 3